MDQPDPDRHLPVPGRPDPSPPLAGPRDYGAFDLREKVGAGGTATVYAASPVGDPDRVLALKEPHVPGSAGATIRERFRREAETWAALDDHDHVVSVLAWDTEPTPWIALEYMDDGTLVDRIGECGPTQGLWIGTCVAAAVDCAHRNGVTHLDLKPSNVLFAASGTDTWAVPKVSDWGTARVLQSETVNLEGLSPRYAAPEQFAPDRFGPAGRATDVYQLGVVLYELLVGGVPFDGPPRALRDAVLEQTPPPPSGRNTALDAAVDGVLDRALAKNPADRYPSMYAFRRELEGLLADSVDADPDPDAVLAGTRGGGLAETPPDPRPEPAPDAGRGDVDASGADADSPFERALTLADEGFVRLSEGYFARHEPAPALDAWRRGVTLVDAHAGRAVPREVAAGESEQAARTTLTARLLEDLSAGTDHVVLGPPGSGKSTVCKQVACEWFDRDEGPVFYRESPADDAFDRPDALASRVTSAEGHALVVVEDAVRPAASAVFELLDRVADRTDVTVLLDARESEWRETDRGSGAFDTPVARGGREELRPVFVPRPDARELERFVEAAETAADRSVDVDVEQLRADVRRAAADDAAADESRPGELFYLLHRLTALARDPLSDGDTGTTLTDAVADTYDRLAAAGADALDVGVCTNVLNAAGVGVYPELLYAVVPDDPLAVHDAVDVLDGRALFPRETDWSGGPTAYPAVHGAWSGAFLAHCLDEAGEETARERFGRVVSRALGLADDPALREGVAGALDGDAPYLARIETDPAAWADETVEAVYTLGREQPKLAPLFGDGERASVDLPAACSDTVAARRSVWLGRLFLAGGYVDRAEQTFERVPRDDTGSSIERLLGRAHVAEERGEHEDAMTDAEAVLRLVGNDDRPLVRARAHLRLGRATLGVSDYEAAEEHFRTALDGFRTVEDSRRVARTLNDLAEVARLKSEYDRAREYHERSLEVMRAVGDRRGIARTLHNVAALSHRQGEYERAREYHERSLEIKRELGDRQGEATSLNNLGLVARRQGEHGKAREYHQRSLEIMRTIGDRQGEAKCLGNLGLVARWQSDYERARDYFERSLAVKRELGDRKGQASSLNNLAVVAARQGQYDRARDYFERGLDIFETIGDRQHEAYSLSNLGGVASSLGEYDEAREYHERSLAIKRELGDRQGEATGLNNLGEVACKRGEYDRAREYHERSLEIKRDLGDREEEAISLNNLGKVALETGEYDRARDYLERGLDIATELGDRIESSISRFRLGEVAIRQDEYDRARECFDRALDDIEATEHPVEATKIQLARGRLALARGDTDLARQRAGEARERFADMGTTHWEGRSRRLLGRVAADADEPAAAREHWRAALSTFEAVSAPQDALATLEHLVEHSRGTGDDRAERWCKRAAELLDSAPDPVADRHREWVRRACHGPGES